MYIEFSCYNKYSFKDIERSVFKAVGLGAKGIAVPINFVSKIVSFIPEGFILSCPIDYPNAYCDTDLRIHYAMKAIQYGANTLDIVASTAMFYEGGETFLSDLRALESLCVDRGVTARIMIDQRKLKSYEEFLKMVGMISKLQTQYIFCSNETFNEDPTDNLILCKVVQSDFGMVPIVNGNFYLEHHFNRIIDSGIYGARFSSHSLMKDFISVYNNTEEKD